MQVTKETKVPGLQSRSTKKINLNRFGSVTNNKGYIGLDFRYMGERIRSGFNGLPYNDRNVREARIFLDKIQFQIKDGTFQFRDYFPQHPKALKFAAREGSPMTLPCDITFEAYANAYYEKNYKLFTRDRKRDIESHLRVHLVPVFGHLTFAELKKRHVKDFVRNLQLGAIGSMKPLKGATIRNILSTFRKIVYEAVDDYEWDNWNDPFRNLKLPPKNPKKEEPLTLEEWEKVKAELPAWYVPYFSFALLTGMRTSEICGLRWEDITPDTIRVRRTAVRGIIQETTKTAKSRRDIALRPPVQKVLEAQRQIIETHYPDSELVFTSTTGHPLTADHHWRAWKLACVRAGVKHRKPYILRHTMISYAILAGEDLQWLATQTGHKDTGMFVRNYWQFINAKDRDDGQKMDRKMAGAEDHVDELAVQIAVQTDPRALRGSKSLKLNNV
jgi:integrase